jgi:hypothetical protein
LSFLQKWLKGGKYFMIGYLTFLWVFNTIIAIIQPYLYSSDEVCSKKKRYSCIIIGGNGE